MLAAGLSTLAHLKSRILPEAAAAIDETTYDAALTQLGLAAAARMERHCNRSFARAVAAADEFSASCQSVTLRRYPVESIASVQLKDTSLALSTCEVDYSLAAAAGVVDFPATPGTASERLVITYTGGYWLDPLTTETLPAGATALPDDLLETWLAEVQLQAEARGLFEAIGLRAPKDADKARKLTGLSEDAIEALRPYRRFAGE